MFIIMTTASSIFSVSMSEHHEFFWSMPNEGVKDIIINGIQHTPNKDFIIKKL